MLGNNCNTSPVNTKSCIEIKDWNSNPQSKGCIKYKGKYYINRITGNTATPEQGILSGSYVVGSEDYCDIIAYHSSNQTTCEESAVFMKFFYGIEEYSNCTEGTTFDCDEFIIFKNIDGIYELHQSLISNNSRHPHDREAWKSLGDFSNILKLIFNEADGKQITLPYWEECKGPNCASVYSKDSSVVEKVDSGKVDNCGNPVYDELIYQSVIDKNTDRPSLGVDKDQPTWLGPYTDMEWVTRQVGYTVNGEDISAGDSHVLVSKDDVSTDNFEWVMTDGVINLITKPVGIDQNGKVITNGSQAELLSKDTFCDKLEWVEIETGECEVDCDPVMNNVICPKPIGTDENGILVNNGSEALLISQGALCDKFEWVDTETETCDEDCTVDTIKQFCPKEVGIDQDGNSINNGSGVSLMTTDAPMAPLQWVDIEQDDCLPNCEHPTKKFLTLCIAKGLQLVDDCLEVFIDKTKGLDFNEEGSIFVKLKNGLGFTPDGEIEVVAANSSIVVDENGVSVGQIGVDRNNNPVMAGDCLVTCDTDIHLASKTETTAASGDTTHTLTMSNGTEYNIVIPADENSFHDAGSVVNGDIVLTSSNGAPDITIPLCDQFWQQDKVIAPDGQGHKTEGVGPTWDAATPLFDASQTVSAALVETLTWSAADLIALGMRPTDNAVIISPSVFAQLRVSATADATPDNIEYGGMCRIVIHGGYDRSHFASVAVVMSDPNGPADFTGEDDKDTYTLEYKIPVAEDGGITVDVFARISKTPGTTAVVANETYPLHSFSLRGSVAITGFAAVDDDTFTAKGGCANQGPNV